MKIILTEICGQATSSDKIVWRFLPDSSFCNAGKPFFIPDFADKFVAILSPVVKISRLGKSIGGKFAGRYFSEVAPAIHFRAPGLMRELRNSGLPDDKGCSFDRSLIVGSFIPLEASTITPDSIFSMHFHGECVSEKTGGDIIVDAEKSIESVSVFNTLKMGDLITTLPERHTPLEIGDRLEVRLDGVRILQVAVK